MNVGDRWRLCAHPDLRTMPTPAQVHRFARDEQGMMFDFVELAPLPKRGISAARRYGRCHTCGQPGEIV